MKNTEYNSVVELVNMFTEFSVPHIYVNDEVSTYVIDNKTGRMYMEAYDEDIDDSIVVSYERGEHPVF